MAYKQNGRQHLSLRRAAALEPLSGRRHSTFGRLLNTRLLSVPDIRRYQSLNMGRPLLAGMTPCSRSLYLSLFKRHWTRLYTCAIRRDFLHALRALQLVLNARTVCKCRYGTARTPVGHRVADKARMTLLRRLRGSAFALVILAGQPEVALYAIFLASSYFLFQSVFLYHSDPSRLIGLIVKGVVSMIIGLMLSAPLTLAFLEYVDASHNLHPPEQALALSTRPTGACSSQPSFQERPSYPPTQQSHPKRSPFWKIRQERSTTASLRRKASGYWLGGSSGVVGPMLALTGLLIALKRRRHNFSGPAIFFTFFTALILLKNFGIWPFLWLGYLPLFDQAWSPRWSGAAWVFALSSTGAIGLQLLTSSSNGQTGGDECRNRESSR